MKNIFTKSFHRPLNSTLFNLLYISLSLPFTLSSSNPNTNNKTVCFVTGSKSESANFHSVSFGVYNLHTYEPLTSSPNWPQTIKLKHYKHVNFFKTDGLSMYKNNKEKLSFIREHNNRMMYMGVCQETEVVCKGKSGENLKYACKDTDLSFDITFNSRTKPDDFSIQYVDLQQVPTTSFIVKEDNRELLTKQEYINVFNGKIQNIEVERLRERVDLIDGENTQKDSTIDNAKKTILELNQTIKKIEHDNNQLHITISASIEFQNSLQNTIDLLSLRLKMLQSDINNAHAQIDTLNKSIHDLKMGKNQLTAQIEGVSIKLEAQDKTINSYKSKLEAQDKTINDYKSKLKAKDETINDISIKLEDKDETIKVYISDLESSKKEVEELKAKIDNQTNLIPTQTNPNDGVNKRDMSIVRVVGILALVLISIIVIPMIIFSCLKKAKSKKMKKVYK